MRKVMVFGVFDGVHDGHKAFFEEARTYGDHLIVVVAQDIIVEELKGKRPLRDMAERFADLEALDGVDEVAIGDAKLGTYEVVLKYQPDIIALGYDQTAMKEDLEAHYEKFDWHPEIKVMSAFEPNKYKSSLLNNP
ncbi:MAG: adenylyltransferase/cytidyltransferase family protein [Patescibacteria group bacterium]